MMTWIFGGMIAIGLGFFAAMGDGAGAMNALLGGAEQAVELTISLAGTYLLWTGLMNIAKEAGLINKLARLMQKPLGLLMPDAGDAMAPVTLNLAANFFGLGNAATPFGVAAMKKMSRGDGIATNDMCMFLALNSSAVELMPATVIAIRTACGAENPYDIILPTFLASVAAAIAAIISCRAFERMGAKNSRGAER